ncbi:hypothetical protein DSM104299_03988 [Baekduia alba]|nr:hypothetical protein DSM104299_03988 [Baekduia alba]
MMNMPVDLDGWLALGADLVIAQDYDPRALADSAADVERVLAAGVLDLPAHADLARP